MNKVIVVKLKPGYAVITGFANMSTENPLVLAQSEGKSKSDLKSESKLGETDLSLLLTEGLRKLEGEIGPISEDAKIYGVCSDELANGEGTNALSALANKGILCLSESIKRIAELVKREVGDTLIVDVGIGSVKVCSAMGTFPVRWTLYDTQKDYDSGDTAGNSSLEDIKDVKEFVGLLGMEAQTISAAVRKHLNDVSFSEQIDSRWIIGTGKGLIEIPSGLELLKESLRDIEELPIGEVPILLDRSQILDSLGVLVPDYDQASWQLLRESLGVES